MEAADDISSRGGTPVLFPSHGLNEQDEKGWVAALAALGAEVDRFIGFELGPMFVPYGRIVSLDAYRGMVEIPQCVGAKHSSLSRRAEWERLALRDEVRPGFQVLTGNDLAIDMVMYGSDYLLGLSTFAPDAFAARDRAWAKGDPAFHELNDVLQYLGQFAFRPPVPAYRHDAAMFFELRGGVHRHHPARGAPPPRGRPRRPRRHRGPPRRPPVRITQVKRLASFDDLARTCTGSASTSSSTPQWTRAGRWRRRSRCTTDRRGRRPWRTGSPSS